MSLSLVLRAFGKHRAALPTLIAALSWGCKPITPPDPKQFQGYIRISAFGMWNIDSAGPSNESGHESLAAECQIEGAASGSMSESLSSHEVTTASDGSTTVSDYSGSVSRVFDSSDLCRPTERVSDGTWEVRIDLTKVQLPKGGTTVVTPPGLTLPLVLGGDLALVSLTAASDPLASGTGHLGCVPIIGSVILHSGDVVGAAAQVANPHAINMHVEWGFWPVDCGATFDLAGLSDMAMGADLAASPDLAGPLSCARIYACLQQCPPANAACGPACIKSGSMTAQSGFGPLKACLEANCFAPVDGGAPPCSVFASPACSTCANKFCANQLNTCLAH